MCPGPVGLPGINPRLCTHLLLSVPRYHTSWASQKPVKLPRVEARQPLQVVENWKHSPWLNSAYAGRNSLRIQFELAEIL